MQMKRFIITLSIALTYANAASYTDQLTEFQKFKEQQTLSFKQYKQEQYKVFQAYKKELQHYWEKPKLSTNKEWVRYSKDQKTRSSVDFANNEITIETVATSEKEAKKKIQIALAKTVTFNTKEAYNLDPLQQRLKKIKKPSAMVVSEVDQKPILAPVIFKKPPTKKDVVTFVKSNTEHLATKKTKDNKKLYFVKLKLPKNTVVKRSQIYYSDVVDNAQKHSLPIELIFAIMHSESSFNPMARSHVPAYGLMQIVPRTAGIDAYKFLYGKKKLLSAQYLYNANNNIKLGSAYLHILYYKYLKDIKNPTSRLYCTIAAYNTGAGNVARAFAGTNSTKKAARIINRLTPNEVYARLLRDLRYEEPKIYLKRVTKRMKIYSNIYARR